MTRILLAEDDPDIRFLVRYGLESAGFTVDSAGDGDEALRLGRRHPPDLCVLDVRMPGLSGIEVCRGLRAGPDTAAVPILMLTAQASVPHMDEAYDAGATDYLIKPFSRRELMERIEALLAGVAS